MKKGKFFPKMPERMARLCLTMRKLRKSGTLESANLSLSHLFKLSIFRFLRSKSSFFLYCQIE